MLNKTRKDFDVKLESAGDRGDLKKLQKVETELVRAVGEICEKHGLRYYLIEGSLLGAVRHEGFIPWDDDIDIGLPRRDYNRFAELAGESLPEGVYLATFENSDYPLRAYNQLRTSKIRILVAAQKQAAEYDVWVDLFPLDGLPDNFLKRKITLFRILYLRAMMQFSQFDLTVNIKKKDRPLFERIIISMARIFKPARGKDTRVYIKKLDKLMSRYNFYNTKYCVSTHSLYKTRAVMPRYYFGEGRDYIFEGLSLKGPDKPHEILTQLYGDYLTPPPPELRNIHHTVVIDPEGSVAD